MKDILKNDSTIREDELVLKLFDLRYSNYKGTEGSKRLLNANRGWVSQISLFPSTCIFIEKELEQDNYMYYLKCEALITMIPTFKSINYDCSVTKIRSLLRLINDFVNTMDEPVQIFYRLILTKIIIFDNRLKQLDLEKAPMKSIEELSNAFDLTLVTTLYANLQDTKDKIRINDLYKTIV